MKKIRANVCLAAVMLIVMVMCSGCGEKKNELRIGYFPNLTHGQALLMREQGNVEKSLEGKYDVSWTSFNAGPAEVEALFAGELDMGFIGPGPAISANVKSAGDFVVVSGAANGGASLVAATASNIKSVADLDGKKVAIPQLGNTQHFMLLNLLSENGLSALSAGGTVEVVAAANADITNLIDQGQIDAAFVPEPWASLITQNENAQIVTEGKGMDSINEEATTVVLVSRDYLEENPEAVEVFLEEFYKATDMVKTKSDEVKQIISNRIKEETGKEYVAEVLKNAFDNIEFTTEVPMESLNGYAQIMFGEQFISQLPDENLVFEK